MLLYYAGYNEFKEKYKMLVFILVGLGIVHFDLKTNSNYLQKNKEFCKQAFFNVI